MSAPTYARPTSPDEAVSAVADDPNAVFLAGGSNLVDHLKLGIVAPSALVSVAGLGLEEITEQDGGLRVGARVRNIDLASNAQVRQRYSVLSRALLSGASAQIRHQATTAGNLLQRTRCVYFQDRTVPCNKREPGSGCPAIEGYGRYNAVLGASDRCVAVHPSDMAVAMLALDAQVGVLGAGGARSLPIDELHRLPGEDPSRDTTLEHGDLITHVDLPAQPQGARSDYVKVRDRASYAFALVSVAASLTVDDDGTVTDVRVAWGGMAHKPWRATLLEDAMAGGSATAENVRTACARELEQASTSQQTAYKLPMVTEATAMLLTKLAAVEGVDR